MVQKYKLIAVDMDDTLLDQDLRISERAVKAVQDLRAKGIHFTLATGRMFCSVQPYAEQLEINLPLITYQGALVKNALSGEVLYHRPVPLEAAREVLQEIKKYGYPINLYVDDRLYVEKMTPEAEKYQQICGIKAEVVGDFQPFLVQDPTKILVIAGKEEIDLLQKNMQSLFGKKLHINKSKPEFLEFSHLQANKGEALAFLAELYGVPRQAVMAFGDGDNDVEMLQFAGAGIAMGNARDDIKALADYVAPGNDEDGVAVMLEKLVLGGQ